MTRGVVRQVARRVVADISGGANIHELHDRVERGKQKYLGTRSRLE